MTKTQQLLALIEAGQRRLSPANPRRVDRLYKGEWITDGQWRADVVARVAAHFWKQARASYGAA